MSHKGEAYSTSGAIFLDNPIRRLIQPPTELIEKLAVNSTDVVVDFGCGPGYYTIELAKKARKMVAVDLSSEMLKKAQRKAEKAGAKNIEFLQSDGKSLQLESSSVDIILLVTVYHEVDESEIVLKEFSRVLKQDGKLVIVENIKKGVFPGAPVQNPDKLKAEIEVLNFRLEKLSPYKNYGILFFTKKG
ncbi:MAG: class I SAM-dependent methyltransferase [Candidatus Bathyarchaeia archaeon]|jgi:ubiquinone/menaquinone biosynthesis C-methylase UbiE